MGVDAGAGSAGGILLAFVHGRSGVNALHIVSMCHRLQLVRCSARRRMVYPEKQLRDVTGFAIAMYVRFVAILGRANASMWRVHVVRLDGKNSGLTLEEILFVKVDRRCWVSCRCRRSMLRQNTAMTCLLALEHCSLFNVAFELPRNTVWCFAFCV